MLDSYPAALIIIKLISLPCSWQLSSQAFQHMNTNVQMINHSKTSQLVRYHYTVYIYYLYVNFLSFCLNIDIFYY